jgi:uncharacterized Tic20 family protein
MTQDPNVTGQTPPPAGGTSTLDYTTPGGYAGPQPTKDECTMAMLCYILGIVTWIIGPLIIWLVKKDSSKFVDDQGKEVINFGITMFLAGIALAIVGIILSHIPVLGLLVMILARLALFVLVIALNITGAMKASKGIAYRYPFALRLIK